MQATVEFNLWIRDELRVIMKDLPKPKQDWQRFIEEFVILWVYMTQSFLTYINLYAFDENLRC